MQPDAERAPFEAPPATPAAHVSWKARLNHEDDTRLLRGHGLYVDDRGDGTELRLVVVRSPLAHGVIRRLDVEEARAMPGVRLVLTAADLDAMGIGPLACRAPVAGEDGAPMIEPRRPVLADGTVKYVGQPVAAIVADTDAQALDAAEAVDLDVAPLPATIDLEEAVGGGAPIWPEAPDNTALVWSKGNAAVVERAFAEAAHVVALSVDHPRVAVAPMEPRGAIASADAEGGLTLWTPSQGVVSLRAAMADCLGVPPATVRVVTDDVGGSFAVKIWPYPEHVLVLATARALGRPVKWTASRTESFTGDAPGRARLDRGALALDAAGRFLAFKIDALADMGAFLNAAAPSIVTTGAVRVFGHVYRIEGLHYRVRAVFTNATPTDAYRGAGKPETVATLERLIDVAAGRLGVDPLELRRRNLVPPDALPYATAMGETYDGGDFPALADALETAADLAGFPQRRAASAARGRVRGLGITFHLHATGGSTAERSEVRALADGTVRVRTGTQDSGQGHHRALARIAAEALDVPSSRVRVEQGDSAWLVTGGGTGGSNLMPVAGNTVHRTALAMLETARERVAEALETATVDLAYEAGRFTIRGTDRSLTLWDLAAGDEAADGPGCMAQLDFEGVHTTFPNGGYACEVELDPETGLIEVVTWTGIDDIGRVIDEAGALGQVHGGIAQSIGEALGEALVHDGEGQLLTGSFMDYALPRAREVPALRMGFRPTASPNSLTGAKGVGEVSSIGAVACALNAVHDALGAYGIEHLDRPLTPSRIWEAIRVSAKEGGS